MTDEDLSMNPRRVAITAVRAMRVSGPDRHRQVEITVLECGEWAVEVQGVSPRTVGDLPSVDDIKEEIDKVVRAKRAAAVEAVAEAEYYESVKARFMEIYENEKSIETLGGETHPHTQGGMGPAR